MTVGVAVIGLGFVGGRAHVPAIKKIPDAHLVAVIDVDRERARTIASKYDVNYYTDYHDALTKDGIDAVIVAVPTPHHYQIVSDAIDSEKHVLCEMPLTPTIAEAEALGIKAAKASVILMPDLNFRFTPNYVKARELIRNGAIGTPLAITYSEFIAAKDLGTQWPLTSWAWDTQRNGGGPDATLSVWSLDLVSWILNAEITEATWSSNYSTLAGIDNFLGYNTMGLVKFSNNAVGVLHYCSTVSMGEETSSLEIYGSKLNSIKAADNNHIVLSEVGTKTEWTFREKGTKAWGHYQLDQYFVECIVQNKNPTITVHDAIQAQTHALQIYQRSRPQALWAIQRQSALALAS